MSQMIKLNLKLWMLPLQIMSQVSRPASAASEAVNSHFWIFDKIPQSVLLKNDLLISSMESGLLEVLQLCSKTRDTYLKNISSFKVGNRCIQLLWRSWAFYHPQKCINAADKYQPRNFEAKQKKSIFGLFQFFKWFYFNKLSFFCILCTIHTNA